MSSREISESSSIWGKGEVLTRDYKRQRKWNRHSGISQYIHSCQNIQISCYWIAHLWFQNMQVKIGAVSSMINLMLLKKLVYNFGIWHVKIRIVSEIQDLILFHGGEQLIIDFLSFHKKLSFHILVSTL